MADVAARAGILALADQELDGVVEHRGITPPLVHHRTQHVLLEQRPLAEPAFP